MDEKNVESGVAKVVGAPEASLKGCARPCRRDKISDAGVQRPPSRAAAANAKEILSGKRASASCSIPTRPGARRRRSARAAAAERERAEEEMIARWKEEDRLKAEAAREKAAAEGTAGAEDGAVEGADGDANGAPERRPRRRIRASTSTLAGRSKRNNAAGADVDRRADASSAAAAARTDAALRPAAHPHRRRRKVAPSSWPVFGCDACDLNRHGAIAARGPPGEELAEAGRWRITTTSRPSRCTTRPR